MRMFGRSSYCLNQKNLSSNNMFVLVPELLITCHDIILGFLRIPSPSYIGFVAIGGVYWKNHRAFMNNCIKWMGSLAIWHLTAMMKSAPKWYWMIQKSLNNFTFWKCQENTHLRCLNKFINTFCACTSATSAKAFL